MGLKNVAIFVILTIAVVSVSSSPMQQFLDLVSLRCLDKILSNKSMDEKKLKTYAEAAVDEMLQTFEFLDGSYLYQVAVVLAGPEADGYFVTNQRFTGNSKPGKDEVLAKYYPMGQFAAYAYVYAAHKA